MVSRRHILIGGGALAVAGVFAARPAERGAMHDAYFLGLAAALKRAGLMHPVMVIDRPRLLANNRSLTTRFGSPFAGALGSSRGVE